MKGQNYDIPLMNGPQWNPGEWSQRFREGEATWSEMVDHQEYPDQEECVLNPELDIEGLQLGVRSRVSKALIYKGVDISDVPKRLVGLTKYRLSLTKYSDCARIYVRSNYDYGKEDKVVIEFYDNKGRFIGDIVER